MKLNVKPCICLLKGACIQTYFTTVSIIAVLRASSILYTQNDHLGDLLLYLNAVVTPKT